MKQASIKCPHCGSSFTVRQADSGDMEPEHIADLWHVFDKAFNEMDGIFRKVFDRKLWWWR